MRAEEIEAEIKRLQGKLDKLNEVRRTSGCRIFLEFDEGQLHITSSAQHWILNKEEAEKLRDKLVEML